MCKPRQNFLSAGGELTRPYLVHISSMSPQGRTAAGESSRCFRVKVFKSKGLHGAGPVGSIPHWSEQNSDAVCHVHDLPATHTRGPASARVSRGRVGVSIEAVQRLHESASLPTEVEEVLATLGTVRRCGLVSNLDKHGISLDYATRMFLGAHRLDARDTRRDHREERRITMGVIEGRVFVVAYTPRRSVARLISARKVNARETDTALSRTVSRWSGWCKGPAV
jgi:uncharacterized protein